MAFVLIALVIFFTIAGLIYFTISTASLREASVIEHEKEAKEIVRSITGTPELTFSSEQCSSCVDFDKALMLKYSDSYKNFWNLDYLAIEKIYPSPTDAECAKSNYPNCNKITLIQKTADFGSTSTAFVTLVSWTPDNGGYFKYEIGKIHVSAKEFNK